MSTLARYWHSYEYHSLEVQTQTQDTVIIWTQQSEPFIMHKALTERDGDTHHNEDVNFTTDSTTTLGVKLHLL